MIPAASRVYRQASQSLTLKKAVIFLKQTKSNPHFGPMRCSVSICLFNYRVDGEKTLITNILFKYIIYIYLNKICAIMGKYIGQQEE